MPGVYNFTIKNLQLEDFYGDVFDKELELSLTVDWCDFTSFASSLQNGGVIFNEYYIGSN